MVDFDQQNRNGSIHDKRPGRPTNPMTFFSWCLNQPVWKICAVVKFGVHFAKDRCENFQKMFELPPPSFSVLNNFFAGSLLLNKRWLNYLWWAKAAWYVQSSLHLIGQNLRNITKLPNGRPRVATKFPKYIGFALVTMVWGCLKVLFERVIFISLSHFGAWNKSSKNGHLSY